MINSRFLNYVHYARQRADIKEKIWLHSCYCLHKVAHDFFHFYPDSAMKASQFHFTTLRDAPADAEVVSHQLMMRAGFIKRLGAGIYTYMPMGLRVIRKVEAIVREEMNRAGAIECTMPIVQPAELWQETGRFEKMGPELLRIQDRHDNQFVIQPTSEEVVTDIARQDLRS